MPAVVRLETVADLGDDGAAAERGPRDQQIPSDQARPGLWQGPRPPADPRRVSVSVTLSAVLDDGRRITLLDDRGWGSTAHWDATTAEEIEDTARTVVGPDEPVDGQTDEDVAAAHHVHLAAVLGRHGVVVDPATLGAIPHDVVVSERLRARLTSG